MPRGTLFTQIDPAGGLDLLLEAVRLRAQQHPLEYGHWYIDGGSEEPVSSGGLVRFSYDSLAPARAHNADAMIRQHADWALQLFPGELAPSRP